ncbi:MAG TPA: DUF4382 domain-containing protein [Methylomirabilota bacterium]|jgi:hypothetical protein|nr:DUF4382 domain-containing protein [Methylomirabilota bacterium]
MKRNRELGYVFFVAVIALAGCSGGGQTTTGGGGGNQQPASLTLTLTSKPDVSLTNISVLSATVSITGITLNPTSGNAVPLTLSPTTYPVDLTRLQADTALLGVLSLPAGSYSGATVTFSAPTLTLDNQSGATLNGTCLTGTICKIALPAGSSQVTSAPFPLTLTAGQASGVSLNLNLNDAVTVTSGTVALNFSAADTFNVASLPRTGAPSGSFDLIEDFVGLVTAKTATSITVMASNGISLTIALPSTPVIEDPQGLCAAVNATCLLANQTVVSVDATVNSAGALTLVSADLLGATPQDELEGTLINTATPGQFNLVVANKVVASGNTTLTAANPGDVFLVTTTNPTFAVDLDEFFNNASLPPANVTTLFAGIGDLVDGQDVMVHVTAATGTAATGDQAVTADQVLLRFTRTTGTLQTVSGQTFTLSNLPPFMSFASNPLVDTISGATNFDGVADVNSLAVGQTVSIRALLVPRSTFSFYAAKVRVQP